MGDAIFRQRNGIYGVGVVAKCGVITPEQLVSLGQLAREGQCQALKFTTRQTLLMLIPEENLPLIRQKVEEIGLRIGVFGEVVRNIKACAAGEPFCLRGLSDVFALSSQIQEQFMDQPVPADFKISVAGCHRGCTDPLCADLGIVATGKNRFDIFLGGRGGGRQPVHGVKFLENVSPDGVIKITAHVLECYREQGGKKERLFRTLQRVGVETFKPEPSWLAKENITCREEENDFLQFVGMQ